MSSRRMRSRGYAQCVELARKCTTLTSERPEERDLATELFDLVDTCWMRGTFEANEATMIALRAGEMSRTLRRRAAPRALSGPFGVGAVGKHAEHAFFTDARHRSEIGRTPVDGV